MLPVIELFERQNISVDFYIKAFNEYKRLLSEGNPPQRARLVLPNSTATKLLMTTNLRQWLHIIEQRTSPHADEEIRYIFKQIRETLFERLELGKIIANEELL
jgi:thymidylate synthase (FAD)